MLNSKNSPFKTNHCRKMRNKLSYRMRKRIQALILQVLTVLLHHQILLLQKRNKTLDRKRKKINDGM